MEDTEILVIATLAVSGATFFILLIYIMCDCARRGRRGDASDGTTYLSERTYLSTGLQEGAGGSKTTTLKSVATGELMLAAHHAGVTSAPDKVSLDSTMRAAAGHDSWPWHHHTDPLSDQVNFSQRTEASSSCQKMLPSIASLEATCNTVARDIDRCAEEVKAVVVTSGELPTDMTAVTRMQTDQQALTSFWGGVRRMLYCADVQLRHAALYQKFYLDLKQLQHLLETTRDTNKKSMTKDPLKLHSADDLVNLMSTTKASVEALRTWESMQRHLAERSVTLVPVALRSQPTTRRLALRALCAYTSEQIHIGEGEALTLVNSENMAVWRVQTAAGVEGDVPAVCLLIPPPDNDAIEATARLHRLLLDTFDTSRLLLEKRVVVITRHLLSDISKKKGMFLVVSGEHKEQLLSRMGLVDTVTRDRCRGYDQYPDIERYLKSIHKTLEASSQQGEEDKKLERDVLGVSEKLAHLFEDYELLSKRYETLKSLFDGVPLRALSVIPADAAAAKSNASVRMLSSSPKDALRMSTDEWKRTLAIQAIVDPDTDEEVSLDIAVNRGIIDPESNAYVNRKTGERYPIPVATAAGFILVSEVGQQQAEAPVTTVEIVGISMRHDTRPYTVWRVREMDSERWMAVKDAVKEGWLRPIVNVYCNMVTGDEMSLDAALDLGLLQVEFPENTVPTVSRVVRYFAMYGLVDQAHNGRVLSYNDAFDRGLLDKGDGTVHDTLTGRWTTIPEALLQRWVRAAVIEDVENFDAQKFIRNHSSSK